MLNCKNTWDGKCCLPLENTHSALCPHISQPPYANKQTKQQLSLSQESQSLVSLLHQLKVECVII